MFTEKSVETTAKENAVCCPLFDPATWDNIHHAWNEKLFLKDVIPEVFHIPLPGTYARAIGKMWKIAKDAGAAPDVNDFLLLAHDPSAFKAELYMSITKVIEGAEIAKLTGDFLSKVYEAGYGDVPKCLRKTDEFLAANAMVSKKYYIYFPYCPKCAKKYGHNYVVVFAETQRV